jgi:hypothetical protein
MPLLSNINFLTGHLLTWPEGQVERDDLLRSKTLTFLRTMGNSQWEELSYQSNIPLYGENPEEVAPPYRYAVICRRSGPRLLVLAEHSRITEEVINKEFSRTFRPHLRSVSILIDPLVKALTKSPTIYALTYAHARVPGELSDLKTLSFYGDDLGSAALFGELLENLIFINCGLKLAAKGKEIVRLGTNGAVSFFPINKQRLDDVERILRFLRDNGYTSESEDAPLKKTVGEGYE